MTTRANIERETNLHYNYFRDFDPAIGRYVQSDPIGLLGGVNTYGYVGGNPVARTDPSGLYMGYVHRRFTLEGAAAAGMTSSMAKELADAVVNADDGTQDPWQGFMHAMCHEKLNEAICQKNLDNWIKHNLNKCDIPGLGFAIHAMQDSHSRSHSGKNYSGLLGLFPFVPHVLSDMAPSPVENFVVPYLTEQMIRQWQDKCSCSR